MPEQPFVFMVDRDVPDLAVEAGDVVIVAPGAEEPIVASHQLSADYGRVLPWADAGALRLVNDDRRPHDLAARVGLSWPPPRSLGSRHLHLVEE